MDPSKVKMNPAGPVRTGMMWQGNSNQSQTHGAVSVLTTVYPGVPTIGGGPTQQSYSNTAPGHLQGGGGGGCGGPEMFSVSGGHAPSASPYMMDQHGPSSMSKAPSGYGHGPDMTSVPYATTPHQRYPQQQQHHGSSMDYHPTMNGPRHSTAAHAAAQAAAAAVATATATATAVAIDQSQFQNYPQDMQYSNQTTYHQQAPMSMASAVQGQQHHQHHHAAGPQMMPPNRVPMPSPYVPVSSGVRAVRPSAMPGPPRYPSGGSMMRPPDQFYQHQQQQQQLQQQMYNQGAPGQPSSMMPVSQRPMMMMNVPQQQQSTVVVGGGYGPVGMGGGRMPAGASYPRPQHDMRAGQPPSSSYQPAALQQGTSASNNGPPPPYGQMMGTNNSAAQSNNYGQYNRDAGMNSYQADNNTNSVYDTTAVSALPNNPTPPLTPAAPSLMGAAVGGGLGGGGYNVANGTAAPAGHNDDGGESRITLPMKNGVILAPFRLEHNSPVSQHTFVLDERTYQTMMSSPNMDLQLKCFHADDKGMSNNWPHNANIQICVNGSPVALLSVECPLYVKSLCQKQHNTLQVAVRQCCCSHLFCLTVVNRPTIESVVREITRLRSIPLEQCIDKIRTYFDAGGDFARTNASSNPEIEQLSVNMSLHCPITMKRLKLPVRGKECKHPQCFDLWAYFEINKDRTGWNCPVCRRPAGIESLEVDLYVMQILAKLQGMDVEEVTLDSSAMWKPIIMPPRPPSPSNGNCRPDGSALKDEDTVPCGSGKRFKPDPDSTTFPSSAPSATSSTSHFQSPVYSRSDSVLSPYQQANNSPAGAFGPASVGSIPNFGSPPPSVRQTRKLSSRGAGGGGGQSQAPPTSYQQQLSNQSTSGGMTAVPSSSDPVDIFGQQMKPHNGYGAVGNPGSIHSIQSPATRAAGSSFPPSNVGNGGGGSYATAGDADNTIASTAASTTNMNSNTFASDFPDFTFDDSDLLGGGDSSQAGPSLFNDPEELLKYLSDPGDYSGFGIPSGGGGGDQPQQPQTPSSQPQPRRSFNEEAPPASVSSFDFSVKNGPGDGAENATVMASSNSINDSNSAASTELASMDEILSLFNK